ncbi:MAG TPA: hypothetical protein VFP10_10085, partial [Candidatus Eisenbacteria bacterium]|nr:hypothetical protein [Candidatus Eisenbacteria bacterium]
MRFPLALILLASSVSLAQGAVFESAHVHPIELSPNGTQLYAVNTDEHRLSVFDLTQGALPVLVAEIPVGLEPVTVRARTSGEVWVVNTLSGSVSIVDLTTLNVKRTLLVGPRPTDVVFAGSPTKAFVSIA